MGVVREGENENMVREGDSEGKRQKEYQSTVKTEKQSQGERENDTESEIVTEDRERRGGQRAEGGRDGGRQDYQAPPLALTPHSSQLRHYPFKAESPL